MLRKVLTVQGTGWACGSRPNAALCSFTQPTVDKLVAVGIPRLHPAMGFLALALPAAAARSNQSVS